MKKEYKMLLYISVFGILWYRHPTPQFDMCEIPNARDKDQRVAFGMF